MAAKSIKSLELHYTMIQFLIIVVVSQNAFYIRGGAFLNLLLTNENISKYSAARQSKLALNTP